MIFLKNIREVFKLFRIFWYLNKKSWYTIIVDNVFESYKELESVLDQLKEHIKQNIIKVIILIFLNLPNVFLKVYRQ